MTTERMDSHPGPGAPAEDGAAGRRQADLDVERMLLGVTDLAPPLGTGPAQAELRLLHANLALERARRSDLVRPDLIEALEAAIAARRGGTPASLALPPPEPATVADEARAVVEDAQAVVDGERDALDRLLTERILARESIDALATELAVLDEAGRIMMVNRAWRAFALENDPGRRDFVGESYLAACITHGDADLGVGPDGFAAGLRELIAGTRDHVEYEYPCHSPTEQRWFLARGARFESDGATRVVVTHENITARRRSEERHRQIAQTLQESLMPPALPAPAGLELAARYRAQGEGHDVGGDFYDVFPEGDGWLLVIGDVCGKGPEAAAVTAEARWTIRALADPGASPAGLLRVVNRSLVGRARRDLTFLTAAVARVTADRAGARVACARAGHPVPLVVRASGDVEEVDGRGGLLGVFDDVRFDDAEVHLGPGDALVLFTDGITEARRGDEELGASGVRAALTGAGGLAAQDLARRLEDAAVAFAGGPLHDDLAIVVVRASLQDPDAPADAVVG
jgi:PAS domain-containing protein